MASDRAHAGGPNQDRFGTQTMLPVEIAESAYKALFYALDGHGPQGQRLPPFHELPEEVQRAYLTMAVWLADVLLDIEMATWSDLAQQTYEYYARLTGRGDIRVAWPALWPIQQLAWQAVTRHIANLISFDDPNAEDIERHEMSWRAWTQRKLAQLEEAPR